MRVGTRAAGAAARSKSALTRTLRRQAHRAATPDQAADSFDSVSSAEAPVSSMTKASLSALVVAIKGTMTAPATSTACTATAYSISPSSSRTTRSPGATPSAINHAASE